MQAPLPHPTQRSFSLRGAYTAIVTPFCDDESKTIDFEALDALVDDQIAAGIAGLVPCGTTGESPTLTDDEQLAVIRRVVERTQGRAQVIAGTGSFSTAQAVSRSRAAEHVGVDGVMVVVPCYNKPTPAGLVHHFTEVAGAVSCPVVLYNIPGRTGVDLDMDALLRICDAASNVVGIKEATGNVLRAQEIQARLGDRLIILSGADTLAWPMIAVGARGVVSVTSNVIPSAVVRAIAHAIEGRMPEARAAHLALLAVHDAMFLETSPAPVKAALAMKGKIRDVLRSPLVPVGEASRRAIGAVLEVYGGGAAS